MGYAAKPLIMCSIPQTDQAGRREYERINGSAKLTLSASKEKYQLPFGRDRTLLYYIRKLVQHEQSRKIFLPSVSKMLNEMDIVDTGTNRAWLKDAFLRCHYTAIFYVEGDLENSGISKADFIISEINGLFLKGEINYSPDKPAYIVVSNHFFQYKDIPIDLNLIHRLGRHYTAIDLYLWMRMRLYKPKNHNDVSFPWRDFKDQLGLSDDITGRHLKQALIEAMEKLIEIGSEFKPKIVGDLFILPYAEPRPVLSDKIQRDFAWLDAQLKHCGKVTTPCG